MGPRQLNRLFPISVRDRGVVRSRPDGWFWPNLFAPVAAQSPWRNQRPAPPARQGVSLCVPYTGCGMMRGYPRCQPSLSSSPTCGHTFCVRKQFLPRNWYFLKPRKVRLGAVTINGDTVTNLRDNQCIDQHGDDGRWQAAPKMWQTTENAETASSDGSYMCVPVQSAIEGNAEISSFRNRKTSVVTKFYREVGALRIFGAIPNSISWVFQR